MSATFFEHSFYGGNVDDVSQSVRAKEMILHREKQVKLGKKPKSWDGGPTPRE